ncbi:MAG TPA: baseplate J/gp47 family protein, partial [Polyangiaceae bacterium]|nr:baseplate J/gp47 family protein [Polyangiaceae bacterium]
ELLSYLPELDVLSLAQSIQLGAHSARIVGRFERLERGRWLVISRGPTVPGLVVRVTEVDLETDTTFVTWDPRRTSAHEYPRAGEPDAAVVFGNVVPAHHGLPIDARYQETASSSALDRALQRWNALLTLEVDGAQTRECELPLRPSTHARGYPFPGERRVGQRVLRLAVDGDPWHAVDDLSSSGPGDEVYSVRAGTRGLPVVRFGDGINGAALPARRVRVQLELSVGGGAAGNVGAQTLRQILRFGRALLPSSDPEALILATPGPERSDLTRSIWKITNPLPAVGGRDPEALESMRYRAPLGVRDALSAVTPRDYETLLLRLPFVAGARARVKDLGPREVVQLTVLLRDEDTLPEAELVRRWAVMRRSLEEMRLLGFDVEAVPPVWVPLDLDLVVEAGPHAVRGQVRTEVNEALAGNGGLFDPDRAGLGGDVRLSDLYDAVQRVNGVRSVRVLRFRRLARGAVEHLADGVIPIGDHEVATISSPRNPGKGLMTLTVCGGLA